MVASSSCFRSNRPHCGYQKVILSNKQALASVAIRIHCIILPLQYHPTTVYTSVVPTILPYRIFLSHFLSCLDSAISEFKLIKSSYSVIQYCDDDP